MKKTTTSKNNPRTDNASTEQKIKETARKLFTSKGFAAVTTRDIAVEAGINQALLHYYFRSKEKLFEIVMLENLSLFFGGVSSILNNQQTSIEQKVETLVATYIDKLSQEPDLPLFIANQVQSNPEKFITNIGIETLIKKSFFLKQFMESDYSKSIHSLNPLHLIINMIGLTLAPFLGAPVIRKICKLDQQHFMTLVQERKTLIPQWILSMVKKRPEQK